MADDPAGTAASNNPALSTLVSAVVAADLVDTLNSDGPFTVFAPFNGAFEDIDPDTLSTVLADTDLLTTILTHHVVVGDSLDAEALGNAGSVSTAAGTTVDISNDGLTIGGAAAICSNVPVANGTVHIIDAVLLPQAAIDALTAASDDGMMGAFGPGCAAVPEDGEGSFAGMADDPAGTAASNNPALSTLVSAVVAADLVDTLNSDGPFTVFAPFNGAFEDIDPDTLSTVLADTDLLTTILTHHVVVGDSLDAEALGNAGSVSTAAGTTVDISNDGLTIGGAAAICSNVPVANGTVHIIDAVLLPQAAIDALTAASDDAPQPELAVTGVETWQLAIIGAAVVGAGGLVLNTRRRFD